MAAGVPVVAQDKQKLLTLLLVDMEALTVAAVAAARRVVVLNPVAAAVAAAQYVSSGPETLVASHQPAPVIFNQEQT